MICVFDIGGTKMRVAVSQDGKSLGKKVAFETPSNYSDGILLLVKTVNALVGDDSLTKVAGGVPGLFDGEHKKLIRSPNLSDWQGKDISGDLQAKLRVPVFIENDAALVALGEAKYGAGNGFPIVGFITVSTGVGGARIVDGRIDAHSLGFEPGHQIIDKETNLTLEDLVSGKSFEKKYSKKPKEITEEKVWMEAAHHLAVGLVNVIELWSPSVLVLGGPMILGNPAIPYEQIIRNVQEISKDPAPEIKKAILGDDGGLLGAIEFANQCS